MAANTAQTQSEDAKLFAAAIEEALQTSEDALKSAESMEKQITDLINEDVSGGISLYDLKNHELSAYLLNLGILMAKMSLGESIEGSKTLDELIKLRVVLERIRPIEKKLKTQVDQLLRGGNEEDKDLTMHARPEMFNAEESEGEGSEDEDSKAMKKYQPPKMVPMHFDENQEEKKAKQLERARKKAMQSSLIQDLRAQYSDAPTLIRDGPSMNRMEREQQKFEELNYTRLQLNKHEKKMTKRKENIETLDSLLKFGDYMAMDTVLEDGATKKKSRGQKRRGGPAKHKGKKKKH
ncbi:unnamed protein product [Bursaphelenchus xylophilus]|uniref:(pine wood nematode) hypothetical protein n=1 Tax=Bursaphelenchus xylophilus TaxID=6326 RepID=A0A1I7S8K9_BURXY|nr:unnamed protein product [Bursaphelenchus xylophilus]CAG9089556.1 unnamed protein product [Bursaphelenchus xylophilus]